MAVHIYVDESGSLPDPYNTVFTLAAIRTEKPQSLRWIIKRVKRRVPQQKSKSGRLPEFKFYNTTTPIRAAVLSELAKEDVAICALSVFKGSQRILHTPENYGLVLSGLLLMCLNQGESAELVVDMPFNTVKDRAALTAFIQNQLEMPLVLQYVSSQTSPQVQLADFVAGAVRTYHSGMDPIFYGFIRSRIVRDERTSWKELKREWHRQVRG